MQGLEGLEDISNSLDTYIGMYLIIFPLAFVDLPTSNILSSSRNMLRGTLYAPLNWLEIRPVESRRPNGQLKGKDGIPSTPVLFPLESCPWEMMLHD